MRISGTLVTVVSSGYERLLQIQQAKSNSRYWVSAVEPEHYAEVGDVPSQAFPEGEPVELAVALRFVTKVELQESSATLGLRQPLSQSPHSVVVAEVTQLPNEHSFVCSLGEQGPEITVECEFEHRISVGQVVAFSGELARAT